ncbi:MAG: hypothetical protein ACHP78_12815 [Terriglobales bacterium]
MKKVLLGLMLAGIITTPGLAQQHEYYLLLDSTVSAARAALLRTGHSGGATIQRADGLTQHTFKTMLPDSSGEPTRVEMSVVMVTRGDTITRIQVRADAQGRDSTAVKSATQYFVRQLTQVFGRPASAGEEAGWCWSTRRRFIDLTVDRAYGSVSLAVGYGSQDR